MPLNDLKERQKQFAEVGRIRLGQKVPTANGRSTRPEKLSTLRFTSAAEHLIGEIARLYGGTVQPWQSPSGPQFEVVTTATTVPVFVYRQQIDPWYEMWGPGVMQRRCDGITEQKRGVPCLCGPDPEERLCKPTTRASVMLADVPGFGVWRVDSHGINAATRGLGGHIADWIASLPDNVRVPGQLMIVPHKEKHLIVKRGVEKIETYEFMVPMLFIDRVTARQIEGGMESLAAAIGAANQSAVGVGQRQAITAGADPDKLTPEKVITLAKHVRDVPALQQLWKDAAADQALTDAAKAALTARAKDIEAKASKSASEPVAAPPAPEPVEVEVVEADADEPDPDALWMQIQAAAHAKGWNGDDIEQRVIARFNRDSGSINGWQMQDFLAAIQAGDVK